MFKKNLFSCLLCSVLFFSIRPVGILDVAQSYCWLLHHFLLVVRVPAAEANGTVPHFELCCDVIYSTHQELCSDSPGWVWLFESLFHVARFFVSFWAILMTCFANYALVLLAFSILFSIILRNWGLTLMTLSRSARSRSSIVLDCYAFGGK